MDAITGGDGTGECAGLVLGTGAGADGFAGAALAGFGLAATGARGAERVRLGEPV